MKSFTFKINCIEEAVLGRVHAIPNPGCSDFTFMGGAIANILNVESPRDLSHFQTPLDLLPRTNDDGSIFDLNIGDIVLFNPSGRCTLVYEKNSFSNSLLLTERCNNRCIMCAQPPNDSSGNCDLARAILELIDSPVHSIGITGGEPTLAWHGLIKVLNRCKEKFPNAEIHLLSNARILKSFEKAEALAEASGDNLMICVPLYSDISYIHDSIVGAESAFWETVEGIYNIERVNINIEIRTIALKQNCTRLPQWSEFIYRFFPFAKHVTIMGMEPIGLALENLNEIWVDPLDYERWLERAVRIINRGNLNVSIYNHQLCTLPQHLWKFTKKSISEWKNIFLEECNQCIVKSDCAGFFMSAKNIRSRGVKTIQ